jgi:hypothetical protein
MCVSIYICPHISLTSLLSSSHPHHPDFYNTNCAFKTHHICHSLTVLSRTSPSPIKLHCCSNGARAAATFPVIVYTSPVSPLYLPNASSSSSPRPHSRAHATLTSPTIARLNFIVTLPPLHLPNLVVILIVPTRH